MAKSISVLTLGALALGLLVTPATAFASGSGGYSGGGYSGGGVQARQVDPQRAAYSRGKKRFKRQITCKSCEYNDGVKGKDAANEVVAKINAGEFNLTPNERNDVITYIYRRYRL